LIEEQTVKLGDSGKSEEVRFRFRPEKSGISFHTLSVFREADRKTMDLPASEPRNTDEATLENNRRIVTIDRTSGPYRILYLAGRPNWEFKFLRRALEEDAEINLVSLIRIANKEPKFSFRDTGGNDTNPLFAGLGENEEEAAQQYDEPVIIRLGVKESDELSDGFPESAEELFGYSGVILDDIESGFFTQDQMLLLRRFVSVRGGGLLLLGGAESFASKDFGETTLGELSPVYAPRSTDQVGDGPFELKLTREGFLQPWVRLRETETQETERLKDMPGFMTVNAVGDIKPGASQLATIEAAGGEPLPALIAQRFGKGRTAALTVCDAWRWSLRRDEKQPDDPGQAWRQLTHWLVNDVPRRAEVRIESFDDPSKPVTIVVSARDEGFQPLDNAAVELTITPIAGEAFTLKADMDQSEAGIYKATYWTREPGGYHVAAKIAAADGNEVGTAETGWTAQSGAAEFADLRLNRQLLEQIAKQTGGEIVRDDRLNQFASELPTKKMPVTENWVYPIWHRAWVLMTAMTCLCLEWGLRRWKGLA
jgi:uncharacterized membrane protein